MRYGKKTILKAIAENYFNERMDGVLVRDAEYLRIMGSLHKAEDALGVCAAPDVAGRLVEELGSNYLSLSSYFAQISYQQGFKDGIALLAEVGMLKQQL